MSCSNCRFYKPQVQAESGICYGGCAIDRELTVSDDLYCDYWEVGSGAVEPQPSSLRNEYGLPEQIVLSPDTEFWVQQVVTAMHNADRDRLLEISRDVLKLAAIRLTVIRHLCPEYVEVVKEGEDDDP